MAVSLAKPRWEEKWRVQNRRVLGEASWERVWDELTDGFPMETVPKGTVLYQQGAPADEVIYLHRGQAQLDCCHSSGKKRAIYAIFDGLTLGEDECMFGGVREFRAITTSECVLCRVPAVEFRRRVESSHALAVKLLQVSARKHQVLSRALARESFLSVGERVARYLLAQAEYYGREEGDGVCITARFTHQEVADFVGTSRVAVSRCLRELEKQGLLEKRDRCFFLPDPAALKGWGAEP